MGRQLFTFEAYVGGPGCECLFRGERGVLGAVARVKNHLRRGGERRVAGQVVSGLSIRRMKGCISRKMRAEGM